MSDELKPCPFCGAVAEPQWSFGGEAVECSECEAMMTAETLSEAIAAWNRRATPPVAHSKSEYKRRVALGDEAVMPPTVKQTPYGPAIRGDVLIDAERLHTVSLSAEEISFVLNELYVAGHGRGSSKQDFEPECPTCTAADKLAAMKAKP